MITKSYHLKRAESMDVISEQLTEELFEAMYELFTQIGVFWENAPKGGDFRTQLYTFMTNRISISSSYIQDYENAKAVLEEYKQVFGDTDKAYAAFFTDPNGLQKPPQTALAKARQKVSNEFISFQLSVGGFKAWGAKNYPGYISGAYIEGEGESAPYRTK